MKTVIIDKPNFTLNVDNTQLHFDKQSVPLRLIETLVIPHDTTLTSSNILRLTHANIALLCISKSNDKISLTLPFIAKNSDQKAAQYNALSNRLGLAKYFVGEKIRTHNEHLKMFAQETSFVQWQQKINDAIDIETLLGIEGSYAKLYFDAYFAHLPKIYHKGKRSKRPPLDPINAMLSYGYMFLYNILTIKLTTAGFDPSISYLHTPFRSHYALASDFCELFRIRINKKVAEWFLEGTLTTDDFSKKDGVYLRYESRKKLWIPLKDLLDDIATDTDKEIALLRSALC